MMMNVMRSQWERSRQVGMECDWQESLADHQLMPSAFIIFSR